MAAIRLDLEASMNIGNPEFGSSVFADHSAPFMSQLSVRPTHAGLQVGSEPG